MSLQDAPGLVLVHLVAAMRIAEALRDGLVLDASLGVAHVSGAKLTLLG